MTLAEIHAKCRRLKWCESLQTVIIDFLQLLTRVERV